MAKYITIVDDIEYTVEILENNQVNINGTTYDINFEEVSGHRVFSVLVDGNSFEVHISEDEELWNVLLRGRLYQAEVIDEREKRLRDAAGEGVESSGEYTLKSPMPGLVIKVAVKVGDTIKNGDVLLILESKKMQNELKSPQDGVVTAVNITEGASVEQKEPLIILGPKS
jgi:biotin carboxyl carrier protein